MSTGESKKTIIAVCGKGGVGKTALCALLSRALLDAGSGPLLLIDADPVAGLTSAIGEKVEHTLAGVRENLVRAARKAGDNEKTRIAQQLDYVILESLVERSAYSLLAMGRSSEKGCYCPANTLLRDAIDAVSAPFKIILIDAEAGLEQINRRVTRRVSRTIAVTDGSRRSFETMEYIVDLIGADRVSVVTNRADGSTVPTLPDGVEFLGALPEDETLRRFDREGRPLWELPVDNPSLIAAGKIAQQLFKELATKK